MNQDLLTKILLIVAVPMLLLIGVLVYGNFQDSSLNTFETTVTNESHTGLAAAPVNITLNSPPVVDGTLTVYNDSANTVTLTEGTDYKVHNLETGLVEIQVNNNTDVYADYTGHGGNGFTQVQSVNQNSYSGFELAAVLPIVVAGVAVLAIVIGAFVGLSA